VALKQYFPNIDVTGLRSNGGKQDSEPHAFYSVICLPGGEVKPAPKTPAKAQ
jgi:hypothetical protein